MKRSEAIRIIEQIAYDTQEFDCINADKFLTELEKHFTLVYQVPVGEAFNYDKDDPEYNIRQVGVHYWEKEDDNV